MTIKKFKTKGNFFCLNNSSLEIGDIISVEGFRCKAIALVVDDHWVESAHYFQCFLLKSNLFPIGLYYFYYMTVSVENF